jgi:hypothetical protein
MDERVHHHYLHPHPHRHVSRKDQSVLRPLGDCMEIQVLRMERMEHIEDHQSPQDVTLSRLLNQEKEKMCRLLKIRIPIRDMWI